jgi:hypothetical protein
VDELRRRFQIGDLAPKGLKEWVYDVNAIDLSRFLHIFREEYATASLFSGPQDQGIPKGKPVQPMQVDSGQNVRDLGRSNIELSQQFDFAASDTGIDVEFASDGDEILLKDLQRHDAGARTPVLSNQFEGASLLRRSGFVVGVDKNIGIEEATGAHEFRFD